MTIVAATLLKGKALSGSFVPSAALTLVAEQLTLFWTLVTTGGPTTVVWFVEFSDDLDDWFQEVDEQDIGSGNVKMSVALRTFQENGGAGLADGTHTLSTQLVRRAQFARVQVKVTAGAAKATVVAPTGEVPILPAS